MKRALTGIAAAAVVLGTAAPMAFAATSSGLTKAGTLPIVVNGSVLSNPYEMTGKDSGNTTAYFPVYYFDQALTKAGFTATWDGVTHTWAITAPGVDASKISIAGGVGTGNTSITVNGTVVKKINTKAAKDPAASKSAAATTYLPVFYIDEILNAIGAKGSFSGQTGLSIGTAQTGASFSAVTVSGNQQGSGTQASPAVSSNGAALDLKTTLTDENGNALPNTAVTVSLAGASGSQPVVSGNGTYVTPTYNSTAGTWNATVNTDASGSIDLSVVGTGAYTVSFQAPYSNNGTAVTSASTYIAFLGANGILSVGNSSPDFSTSSNGTAGVTPVTFTLPLNSSSDVQKNTEVTLKITTGSAQFTTQAGQSLGQEINAYSDNNGQVTAYVNDFVAEDVTIEAAVGKTITAGATTNAEATLTYQNPNNATATINNIGVFAFASQVSGASTSSASSVTGLPYSTSAAYFAPVGNDGSILSGSNAVQTYQLSADNSATIASILTTTAAGTYKTTALTGALAGASNITITVQQDAKSGYDFYANGVEIVTGATDSTFGVELGEGSSQTSSTATLTVADGSIKSTAGFYFGGNGATYVTNVTPPVASLGVGDSETLSFTVVDAQGNPVADQSAVVAFDSAKIAPGYWVTAVNGKTLGTTDSSGTFLYQPIPLGTETVTPAYGSVYDPGVAAWGGSNTFTVNTDGNGLASITIQNGNVWYDDTSKGNIEDTTDVATSSDNIYGFTYSGNTTENTTGAINLQASSSTPYGTGNGSQVSETDSNVAK